MAHEHERVDDLGREALVDSLEHYFTAPAAMPLMM